MNKNNLIILQFACFMINMQMEEVLFLKIKKEPPSVCAGYLPERLHLEGG